MLDTGALFSQLYLSHLYFFIAGIICMYVINVYLVSSNKSESVIKDFVSCSKLDSTGIDSEANSGYYLANNSKNTDNVPLQLPPISTSPPKHVAVIMDGNRRYGRKQFGNPLQVRMNVINIFIILN